MSGYFILLFVGLLIIIGDAADSGFRGAKVTWAKSSSGTVVTMEQRWQVCADCSPPASLVCTYTAPSVVENVLSPSNSFVENGHDVYQWFVTLTNPATAVQWTYTSANLKPRLSNDGGSARNQKEIVTYGPNTSSDDSSPIPVLPTEMLVVPPNMANWTLDLPVYDPAGEDIYCRYATFGESFYPSIPTIGGNALTLSSRCRLSWDTTAGAVPGTLYGIQVYFANSADFATFSMAEYTFVIGTSGLVPTRCLPAIQNVTLQTGDVWSPTFTFSGDSTRSGFRLSANTTFANVSTSYSSLSAPYIYSMSYTAPLSAKGFTLGGYVMLKDEFGQQGFCVFSVYQNRDNIAPTLLYNRTDSFYPYVPLTAFQLFDPDLTSGDKLNITASVSVGILQTSASVISSPSVTWLKLPTENNVEFAMQADVATAVAALNSFVYRCSQTGIQASTTTTITIVVSDMGSSGFGGAKSNTTVIPLRSRFTAGDTCPLYGACDVCVNANFSTCSACATVTPWRCGDGQCVALQSQCSTPNVCPSAQVHCWDGRCASTYQDCRTITLDSCSNYLCSDGSCRASVADCPALDSCTGSTRRCWDGTCRSTACPTVVACGSGTRCQDGDCRSACSSYYGCSYQFPYSCPDGRCAVDASSCQGGCAQDRCVDGSCASSGQCASPLNRVYFPRVAVRAQTQVNAGGALYFPVYTSAGALIAAVTAPSGAMSIVASSVIVAEPVPTSIVQSIGSADGKALASFSEMLSVIVKLSGLNIAQPFGATNLTMQVNSGAIASYCLAILNNTNQWHCVDEQLIQLSTGYVSGYITQFGTYAVVIAPPHTNIAPTITATHSTPFIIYPTTTLTGLYTNDSDSGIANIQLTVQTSSGSVYFADATARAQVLWVSAQPPVTTAVFQAPLSVTTAMLQSLQLLATQANIESGNVIQMTITVNDLGNRGIGGQLTAQQIVTLNPAFVSGTICGFARVCDDCAIPDISNCPACTVATPVRCPDGHCVASYNLCPLAISCAPGETLCADATCASSPSLCLSRVSLNESCTGGEVKCPDGACRSSIAACVPVTACYPGTFRCADGSCNADTSLCPAVGACAGSMTRCQDGVCRTACPPYDGCPSTAPIECDDGRCVASSSDCAQQCFYQGLRRCVDGTCGPSCETPLNQIYVSPISVNINASSVAGLFSMVVYAGDNSRIALLSAQTSGFAGLSSASFMSARYVPRSVWTAVTAPDARAVFSEVISPVVKLVSNVQEPYTSPLNITLLTNLGVNETMYCLAFVNASNVWDCVDEHLSRTVGNYMSGLVTKAGTYAIVTKPLLFVAGPSTAPQLSLVGGNLYIQPIQSLSALQVTSQSMLPTSNVGVILSLQPLVGLISFTNATANASVAYITDVAPSQVLNFICTLEIAQRMFASMIFIGSQTIVEANSEIQVLVSVEDLTSGQSTGFNILLSAKFKSGSTIMSTVCPNYAVCHSCVILGVCATACSPTTPYRCGDGSCVASQSQCPAVLTCPVGQYLCGDGSCQPTAATCRIKLENAATCVSPKVMCPDGSCRANIQLCAPIAACTNSTLRCADGSCAINQTYCGPAPTCTAPQTLCQDGVCRSTCPVYFGCPYSQPYLCPDSRCVAAQSQCIGSCNATVGEMRCVDGQCLESCSIAPKLMQIVTVDAVVSAVWDAQQDTTVNVYAVDGSLVAMIQAPAGSLTVTPGLSTISARGVAASAYAGSAAPDGRSLFSEIVSVVVDLRAIGMPSFFSGPVNVSLLSLPSTFNCLLGLFFQLN
eukprot:TRINITY_DN4069_c0_g1_i2.p1 TRINITY_DN4069_c0_g1~~TRINITY_DN4069_c0_g1_i2.p1  ORF type:complete len:1767 (+),score=266.89 TRINITY_DN4069_c0_g1_i2:5422-10722(+)